MWRSGMLWVFIALGISASSPAQIAVSPLYRSGESVIVSVQFADAPDGATPTDVTWSVSAGAVVPLDATRAAIWPAYSTSDQTLVVRCTGLLVGDGGKYIPGSLRTFEARTTIAAVGDSPEPGPGPQPGPEPQPQPTPGAPIPLPGVRVLFLVESADATKIPPGQQSAMYSKMVRDWLDTNCAKSADGHPERLWVDPDGPWAAGMEHWEKASKRPRSGLPWVIISNGTKGIGFEGAIPDGAARMVELLEKYR